MPRHLVASLSPEDVALLAMWPRWADRFAAAEIIKRHAFRTSPRTLERWPVPIHVVAGRAHGAMCWYLAVARRRVAAAGPPLMPTGARAVVEDTTNHITS
jgi:hypothetical protein